MSEKDIHGKGFRQEDAGDSSMSVLLRILRAIKGTLLHPQWLSDRFHAKSRRCLMSIDSGRVLDIGSGDSDHSSLFGNRVQLFRLDYPGTNAWYRARPDIFGDATCLPVSDCSMDSVLLLEVMEHVPDYRAVMRECRRVLSADGRLFLSVPFVYPVHDAPHDYHRFTVHGLVSELEQAGFEIEDMQAHGNSIVVAIQMMNLSLLEMARLGLGKHLLLGAVLVPVVYLACLANNLLAVPFLWMRFNRAAVFGHFVIARPGSR
ncbi:class I SAM-dependent methyltransferase [Thiolapillus sp.]